MSRRRSRPTPQASAVQETPQENEVTATSEVPHESEVVTPAITPTVQKERKRMPALNPAQLNSLLAKSKVKGSGEIVLKEFLASGDVSTEVDLASGPLAGKSPEQAATTLRNAQKRVVTDTTTGQSSLAIPDAGGVRIVTAAVDENGEPVKADKAHPPTTVYLINTTALTTNGDGEAAAE